MSYRIHIGFKKVKNGDEAGQVLSDYKRYVYKKLSSLFDTYSNRMTFILRMYEHEHSNADNLDLLNKVIEVITEDFNNAFFYDKIANVVGIVCPKDTADFFDKCVFFQGSCDQDYIEAEGKGVPAFEEIFSAAMRLTKKELIKLYPGIEDASDTCDLDYYRRSYAYEQIGSRYESKIFNNDEAIYLSLFRQSYPADELISLAKNICNHYFEIKEGEENG